MPQLRENVDAKYKWDLSKIYKNDSEWLKELSRIEGNLSKISDYQGHILDSSDNLFNLLEDENKIDLEISKLYVYAKMKLDEDSSNSNYQDFVGKITTILTKWSTITSFIDPELLESDYEIVKDYINSNKKLKTYDKVLKDVYRYQPYVLSKSEEKIIASLSKVLSNSEEIAYYLRNSDMKFGQIKDENNKKIELTDSNYSIYIRSKNRKVRKRTFDRMFSTYESLINTYASSLSSTVEVNNKLSELRGYNSALEASLFRDDIDIKLYDKLISEVHEKMSYLFKYYKIKKHALKVDELHIYDLYAEMVRENDKRYEYNEAHDLIVKALSVFGHDYVNNLERAFTENWIDVFENKGKKSGAYSWGAYGTNPYILTNYNYDYNSVSTLAHELGHSMHTLYSNTNNSYHEAGYPIFLAEIASTVNELLLSYYILDNSNDINEKKYIISNMLELYRATIYRQTMFAEFEKKTHELNSQNVTLTSDTMSNAYYEILKPYFMKNIKIDSKIKYEWARIPHFYDAFYVYKYATGLSIATYIVDKVRKGDKKFIGQYIELLKSGGKDYPLELLKNCGIDILNDDIISSSLDSFNNLLDEFTKLV